jgi:hypothetical protein
MGYIILFLEKDATEKNAIRGVWISTYDCDGEGPITDIRGYPRLERCMDFFSVVSFSTLRSSFRDLRFCTQLS